MDLIKQKSDGVIGVLMGLMALSNELSEEDFRRFCENTPNGSDLWDAMKVRRDAGGAPEGYNFIDYAHEVLNSLG